MQTASTAYELWQEELALGMREVGVYLCGKIQEAVRWLLALLWFKQISVPTIVIFPRGTASTELKVDGIVLLSFLRRLKKKFYPFIWLHRISVLAWPRIEPRPPSLGVWRHSHWSIREAPVDGIALIGQHEDARPDEWLRHLAQEET